MSIMGINGLWQILKPAAQIRTLSDVTLMNGYSAIDRTSFLRIGADISVIMNECVAADKAAHMYRHRSGGALRIFFFKLCKFLREAPIIVIFVFDGPDRPSFKHGRKINTRTIPEWSQQCKAIIELFGFYWLQAPGEAEAELALLSRNKAIDVILTSDSDSLVFGAGHVMKSIAHSETYEIYNMDVIKDNPSVGLSQGGLLLIAVLSGGDYSDGLSGCGSTMSAALARCGFGDRLLRAFNKLESIKLDRELELIARGIEDELRYNTSGFLTARNPKLASKFSVKHIAPDKVSAYLYPVVSASPTSNLPNWIARQPNIPQISKFCAQTLNWASNDLEKKIQNILWPGVFLRIITSPLLTYSSPQKMCLTPKNQSKILSITTQPRKSKPGNWARIKYSTENFIKLLGLGIQMTSGDTSMKTWIQVEYIPDVILSPSLHDANAPHPYPGSIAGYLDSLQPAASSSAHQRREHPEAAPPDRAHAPRPYPGPVIELSDSESVASSSSLPSHRTPVPGPYPGLVIDLSDSEPVASSSKSAQQKRKCEPVASSSKSAPPKCNKRELVASSSKSAPPKRKHHEVVSPMASSSVPKNREHLESSSPEVIVISD